jgi:hypothetical protein
MDGKDLKPLRITDKKAIALIHKHAPKQHRSLANCAASLIIAALSGAAQNKNTDNLGVSQEEKGRLK